MAGFRMLPSSPSTSSPLSPTFTSQLEKAFISSFFPSHTSSKPSALFDILVNVGPYLKATDSLKTLVSLMRTSRGYLEALKGMLYKEFVIPLGWEARSLGKIGMRYRRLIKSITIRDAAETPCPYNSLAGPFPPRKDPTYTTHLFSFIASCYNLRNLDCQTMILDVTLWPKRNDIASTLLSLTTLTWLWDTSFPIRPTAEDGKIFDWGIPFPNMKHMAIIFTGWTYWIEGMRLNGQGSLTPEERAAGGRQYGISVPSFPGKHVALSLVVEDTLAQPGLSVQIPTKSGKEFAKDVNLIVLSSYKWMELSLEQDFVDTLATLYQHDSIYISYIGSHDYTFQKKQDEGLKGDYLRVLKNGKWPECWNWIYEAMKKKAGDTGEQVTLKDARCSVHWQDESGFTDVMRWKRPTSARIDDYDERNKGFDGKLCALDRMELMMRYEYWDSVA